MSAEQRKYFEAIEEIHDRLAATVGGVMKDDASEIVWNLVVNGDNSIDFICAELVDQGLVVYTPEERIQEALAMATRYANIDGAHHKMWTIDQMVRVLAGVHYREFVKQACDGDEGPNTYEWDIGTPP